LGCDHAYRNVFNLLQEAVAMTSSEFHFFEQHFGKTGQLTVALTKR